MKPKKIFSKEEIKNWALYEEQLANYTTVSQMFESIFKKWTSSLDNPFSILWVRQLQMDKLGYLEKLLANIKGNNIELLEKITEELLRYSEAKEDEIIKKILSTNGELIAAKYLVGKFGVVKPLGPVGDYICDDNTFVSVKTKMDEHFNRFILQEYMRGLASLEEYSDILKYQFSFELKNINDSFRKKIMEFLRDDIVRFINSIPKPCNEYEDKKVSCNKNDINISGCKYLTQKQNKIEIVITEAVSEMQMVLTEHDCNFVDFAIDVIYPDEQKYIFTNIERSIDEWIEEFENKSQKDKQKTFWGWINIPLTYSNESGFQKQKAEIEKTLEEKCKGKFYKIVFCFFPHLCYEINEPIMFVYN